MISQKSNRPKSVDEKLELVIISLKIPRMLKDKFKAKLASKGKKMGPVILQFIKSYIKNTDHEG